MVLGRISVVQYRKADLSGIIEFSAAARQVNK
jgi:hypothetical protein